MSRNRLSRNISPTSFWPGFVMVYGELAQSNLNRDLITRVSLSVVCSDENLARIGWLTIRHISPC